MRETNTHGRDVIFAPRDVDSALVKLASLSEIAAKREWERAFLVALIVEPKRTGRPSKSGKSSGLTKLTIADFCRKGIYGLRSDKAVRAYLKAWEMSGCPAPMWGIKNELPPATMEFPDAETLYGRLGAVESVEPPQAVEDDDPDNCTEEDTEEPQQSSLVRTGPKTNPVASMLESFLAVLDKADPAAIVHGQPEDKVELLIKTMQSWIDSLREAVKDGE